MKFEKKQKCVVSQFGVKAAKTPGMAAASVIIRRHSSKITTAKKSGRFSQLCHWDANACHAGYAAALPRQQFAQSREDESFIFRCWRNDASGTPWIHELHEQCSPSGCHQQGHCFLCRKWACTYNYIAFTLTNDQHISMVFCLCSCFCSGFLLLTSWFYSILVWIQSYSIQAGVPPPPLKGQWPRAL